MLTKENDTSESVIVTKENDKSRSVIGVDATFKGEIKSKGILRIDGTIEGVIRGDSVILGEKGVVQADITAKTITIGGNAEGHFKAKEFFKIAPKGKVLGHISTAMLLIARGGTYNSKGFLKKFDSDLVNFLQESADTK